MGILFLDVCLVVLLWNIKPARIEALPPVRLLFVTSVRSLITGLFSNRLPLAMDYALPLNSRLAEAVPRFPGVAARNRIESDRRLLADDRGYGSLAFEMDLDYDPSATISKVNRARCDSGAIQ